MATTDNSFFLREPKIFRSSMNALARSWKICICGAWRTIARLIYGRIGRTPKISPIVGRDHWPQLNCALLAGGTMRHGQVVGATDRIAGEALTRPVTFGEVYATLFKHLGNDAGLTTINDLNGRPQYLGLKVMRNLWRNWFAKTVPNVAFHSANGDYLPPKDKGVLPCLLYPTEPLDQIGNELFTIF